MEISLCLLETSSLAARSFAGMDRFFERFGATILTIAGKARGAPGALF